MGTKPSLALVVPFHNEARYLPALVRSLADYAPADVPIVFVDNASTDGSADLVRQPSGLAGRHQLLTVSRVGKFHAMAAGAAWCLDRLEVSHVAYLDADCVCSDGDWLGAAREIVQQHGATLGYLHSPYVFHDLADLPIFADAYRAYVAVEALLAQRVAWFGHAGAAVYDGRTLVEYFGRAGATSEIGLRVSLFALASGRAAVHNPVAVRTSPRRLLATPANFQAWTGYRRAFYAGKDLNAADKLNLHVRAARIDLAPDEVEWFFECQAIKFAARNLIPLAVFDRSERVRERLERFFAVDLAAAMRVLRCTPPAECLLGDGFAEFLATVRQQPCVGAIAAAIRGLLIDHAAAARAVSRQAAIA